MTTGNEQNPWMLNQRDGIRPFVPTGHLVTTVNGSKLYTTVIISSR